MMATGLSVGGDIEQAPEGVGVPSDVLDTSGIVRWINPAAKRLVGDVRGRHFSSVVAPEDSRRARELFSRKVLGTSRATKQIAAELHPRTETVRNHLRRLFRALGVNSRLEAVAAARATASR